MNKTQLIEALRAHLADKEDIANEAAPALALMRYSLVELMKPTNGQVNDGEAAELRKELASADAVITRLNDELSDRDGYLYGLLAEVALVPEIDDEPVDSLREAIEQQPDILDALQDKISVINAGQGEPSDDADDKDRFIAAVRELLEASPEMGLQDLWSELESKAQWLTSLVTGIDQRDQQIAEADKRLSRVDTLERIIRNSCEAAGLPKYEDLGDMPVYELEEGIKLIIKQRDAAQERGAAGRNDVPAEGTLEAIIDQIITITHTDWQDVEHLPKEIQQMRDNLDTFLFAQKTSTLAQSAWVSDAIDLAHAVRGNLAPENRVMAKAAEAIILRAPEVTQ